MIDMIQDFLSLNIDDIAASGAALAAGLATIVFWLVLVDNRGKETKFQAIEERREKLVSKVRQIKDRDTKDHFVGMKSISRLVEKMRSDDTDQHKELVTKLAQAGYRNLDAILYFFYARIVVAALLGCGAFFYLFVVRATELSLFQSFIALVITVGLGYYLPEIFIRNQTDKRKKALSRALPDVLDLLVICADAGLSLDAALKRIAGEVRQTCSEMSAELELTSVELSFLPDRQQALENLNERTGLTMIQAVVNSLRQSEKYGTPIAHSLRVLASEFRSERMLKAEEKAARLPALMTVPLMLFIFPPLFVVIGGPAVLKIMDSFSGISGSM